MNIKDLIIKTVEEFGHISMKELYQNVNREEATSTSYVSKLTKELVKKGTLMVSKFENEDDQYEINVGPHDHFVCKECGKIINLNSKIIAPDMNADGNVCYEFRLTIYGKCKDCNKSILN